MRFAIPCGHGFKLIEVDSKGQVKLISSFDRLNGVVKQIKWGPHGYFCILTETMLEIFQLTDEIKSKYSIDFKDIGTQCDMSWDFSTHNATLVTFSDSFMSSITIDKSKLMHTISIDKHPINYNKLFPKQKFNSNYSKTDNTVLYIRSYHLFIRYVNYSLYFLNIINHNIIQSKSFIIEMIQHDTKKSSNSTHQDHHYHSSRKIVIYKLCFFPLSNRICIACGNDVSINLWKSIILKY